MSLSYAAPTHNTLPANLNARRVTPIFLVDDIAAARRRYSALGFKSVETGKTGRLGMAAGETDIMLVDSVHAARTMPLKALKHLNREPALYVWVDSIDEVRHQLVEPIIGERVTDDGAWELFVDSRIGLVIFAERVGKVAKPH